MIEKGLSMRFHIFIPFIIVSMIDHGSYDAPPASNGAPLGYMTLCAGGRMGLSRAIVIDTIVWGMASGVLYRY